MLLDNIVLHGNSSDRCLWIDKQGCEYMVKEAYNLFYNALTKEVPKFSSLVWNKLVP